MMNVKKALVERFTINSGGNRFQRSYATLVKPSKDLTVVNALKLESILLKKIFKKQMARQNEFYTFPRFLYLKKKNDQYLEMWKKALIKL